MVDMMSFWTFSDVFEEGGPAPRPFEGAFGLRAKGGINKPSYYAFALLHELGDRRVANPSTNVIVTERKDNTLVIAVWNLVDPEDSGGPKTMKFQFLKVPQNAEISIRRVDDEHGNVLPKYAAMGKPLDPTEAQVEQLNRETALGPPQRLQLKAGQLECNLERDALVLIEIKTK